eukprot:1488465-Amphidinium_carterae.2
MSKSSGMLSCTNTLGLEIGGQACHQMSSQVFAMEPASQAHKAMVGEALLRLSGLASQAQPNRLDPANQAH